jgi:hypothetical protein
MEVSVPLGSDTWIRKRADEPSTPLINRYFEQNPTNTEDQVGLIERPALIPFASAGQGPGRRLFHQPGFSNDDLFHVSGLELYKHHMNADRTITTTQITGQIQGSGAPDMCATNGNLFITDGFTLQYTNGTAALATIDTTSIGSVSFSSIDVFNGYVIGAVANKDRFYWLQPGALTFNALDFATAERFPDKIMQVRAVGDEFWLLGEKSVEVWRATGDGIAPFNRIEGRVFNFGTFDGTAVRMKDTSVLMVADDGSVFDITGNPSQISNPAIAESIRDQIFDAKTNGL